MGHVVLNGSHANSFEMCSALWCQMCAPFPHFGVPYKQLPEIRHYHRPRLSLPKRVRDKPSPIATAEMPVRARCDVKSSHVIGTKIRPANQTASPPPMRIHVNALPPIVHLHHLSRAATLSSTRRPRICEKPLPGVNHQPRPLRAFWRFLRTPQPTPPAQPPTPGRRARPKPRRRCHGPWL